MDLFNRNGALFSQDRKYRYSLWRIWDEKKPMVMFVGINPSTANEASDDPTIRRVKRFALDWGFGGVYMANLFAFVTPYPAQLLTEADPIGHNDEHLQMVAQICGEVVFAWGAFKEAAERAEQVKKMFPEAMCLALNANGSPKHPLYVKGDTVPVLFHCK